MKPVAYTTANTIFLSERTLEEAEKLQIEWTLRRFGYNKTIAAESLGISRRTLFRKIVKHGIDGKGKAA